MKYYYDLHIHTALSPCADNDMTPNNIVNMALLKGLDVIAVTDHNSAMNVEAVYKVGLKKGLIVVPGIEVETKEEVHILCYFYNLQDCLKFGEIINNFMIKIKNNSTVFGNQFIINEEDEIIGEVDNLLISSSNLSINDVFEYMRDKGVAVPAHVDRTSFGIISNLGFIPDMNNLKSIELSKNMKKEKFFSIYPEYKKYNVISSSDAHYLGNISEKEEFLQCCNELKSIVDCIGGFNI